MEKAAKVHDDSAPTPSLEDVTITTMGRSKAKTMIMKAFPDSRCEQSMISLDLLKPISPFSRTRPRMSSQWMDPQGQPCSRLNIKAARPQVTLALQEEVIFSRKMLKNLAVLRNNFLMDQAKTKAPKATSETKTTSKTKAKGKGKSRSNNLSAP